MISKFSLDFDEAAQVLTRCIEAAAQAGAAVSVAVVDDAGHLLRFARMDGARAFTVDLASRKARVACSVGLGTTVVTEASRGSPIAVEAAVGAGGVPIPGPDQLPIGAVGVSGAPAEIDDLIAEAGASWAGAALASGR